MRIWRASADGRKLLVKGDPKALETNARSRLRSGWRKPQQLTALLPEPFAGDAHALLQAVYMDTRIDIALRLDAAKAAIRYERPALSSIDQKQIIELATTVRQPEVIDSRLLSYDQRAQLRVICETISSARERDGDLVEGPED